MSIIVPTYNERENIRKLIELLDSNLKEYEYEIVVVDDASPDGTADEAEKLGKLYPVKVVRRPGKLGLTSAIYDGIRASKGKFVVVMDADLQHPPEVVPRLIKKLEECDLVVASRYVRGGKIENWSTTRRLMSIGATLIARIFIPGCVRVHDPLSGFFAARREILEHWKPVEPKGYKALVELLHSAREARVCEEPFIFRGRVRGKSKLSSKVILAFLKVALKLGFKRVLLVTGLFLAVLLAALLAT